ncbi:GTPase [Chloroflexota bacterium]
MPANLPPQYFEAEKVYRRAKTAEEKIEALENMLAIMPKHKGTDKLRAELRARIAKLTDEADKRPGMARRGDVHGVRREGAGQLVMVGLPNVGKSQIVSVLTDARPEVADYPFTTKDTVPGMMMFEDIQIQLVDLPPLTDKAARPWLPSVLKRADILLIVVDLAGDPLNQMQDVVKALGEMRITPVGLKGLGDVEISTVKKAVIVGNKCDWDEGEENYGKLRSSYGDEYSLVAVSARIGTGLEEMKRLVYEGLDIIRVYTKAPGERAGLGEPVALRKGSTVEDAAMTVHKDFARGLKFARIWGSGKFDGQKVKRGHVLEDRDVIELHI